MRESSPLEPVTTRPILTQAIVLLLGIALGAIGAVTIVKILRQRDAYPRGVMNVMQHRFAMLKQDIRRNRCDLKANAPALASLQEFAGDLEQVFYPEDPADAPFREHAQRLRDALAAAAVATNCPALRPTIDKIGAACDGCHREYR